MEDYDETAVTKALILGRILDKLDLRGLKSARQVSQSWCIESSPILKRKSCLRLRQFRSQEIYHLVEFLKTSRSDGEYFVDTVYLDDWSFISTNLLIEEFLNKVGPWIRVLKLTNPIFTPFTKFKSLLYYKLPRLESFVCSIESNLNMPTLDPSRVDCLTLNEPLNLTSFHINFKGRATFHINWKELFTNFSKLKEFHVECYSPTVISEITVAMTSVRQNSAHALNLEKLSLVSSPSMVVDEEDTKLTFQFLKNMNLPLVELKLRVEDTKELALLLKHYKNTLRVVKLCSNETTNNRPWFLSTFSTALHHVEELDLGEGLFRNFDILNFFPACKTLRLVTHGQILDDWATTATTLTPRPSLTSLKITDILQPLRSRTVLAIAQTFPSLITLAMRLTDMTLRVVFSELSRLRELTIFGYSVSDEGLTGFDGVNRVSLADRNANVLTDRTHPYIGDMRHLRRFELGNHSFHVATDFFLTDFSITHGLVDLVELEHVSMPHTCIHLETVANLKQNIQRLNLDIPCSAIGVHTAEAGLFSVPVPIVQPLEGNMKLIVGSRLFVHGFIPQNPERFIINLNVDEMGVNRAFHFNPRWDQGRTVFNSKLIGNWGPEESFYYSELYPGINVCVQITCQTESFLVEVNDFTPIVYRYRTPLETINFIEVCGHLRLDNIYFQ